MPLSLNLHLLEPRPDLLPLHLLLFFFLPSSQPPLLTTSMLAFSLHPSLLASSMLTTNMLAFSLHPGLLATSMLAHGLYLHLDLSRFGSGS